MEKVKLPQEVAKAIEYLRSKGETTADIIIHCFGNANAQPFQVIRGFWDTHQDFDRLLQALVNGYEVEQTPGEKVREYYQSQLDEATPYGRGVCLGIKETLDLLNIKIPGVNANE